MLYVYASVSLFAHASISLDTYMFYVRASVSLFAVLLYLYEHSTHASMNAFIGNRIFDDVCTCFYV